MPEDDKMWTPSQTGDNNDDNPTVVANQLRALQRDVNDGFDRVGRALEGLGRIDAKLDVIIDRQNVLERRLDAQQSAIADLSRWQSQSDSRLAALETKKRKRK